MRRRASRARSGPLRSKSRGPKVVGLPHAIVVGGSRTARAVGRALGERGIRVIRAERPDVATARVTEQTRAIFLVPPLADVSAVDYARRVREDSSHVPIFVALRGPLPERGLKELYAGGVHAVFEWPTDKPALLRTAFRLVAPLRAVRGSSVTPGDVALEELVKDRLRTAPLPFGGGLVAQVRHRCAILSGRVDALYKVHVAEQIAGQVPGVDDVVSVGVDVTTDELSDRAISNAIRQTLKHASRVDGSTLAFRVAAGRVTLSGTARDRHELTSALKMIEHVRGVRGVECFATVSEEAKDRDNRVAKRARAALRTHHPKAKVEVVVFSGVAVLSGRVAHAAERGALTELVEGQRGVRRVVDKLRVRAPRNVRPIR